MRKRYKNINLLLRGILSIALGIALFIFREKVIIFFTQVIIAFLFLNGGAKFMQVVMWQRSNRRLSEIVMQLIVASGHLMIASWLLLEQDFIAEGRNIEKLGLTGKTADEIFEMIK